MNGVDLASSLLLTFASTPVTRGEFKSSLMGETIDVKSAVKVS